MQNLVKSEGVWPGMISPAGTDNAISMQKDGCVYRLVSGCIEQTPSEREIDKERGGE